jgi:CNT family concentrative nucleoside transporter
VERLFGWLFAPLMLLAGVPAAEAYEAGRLMGMKTALNELIAYLEFGATGGDLSARTRLILAFAMCGFANFGSLGIMIGGLASIVPERREEIVNLGLQALVSGTLATLMTGAVVGALPAALFAS